MRRTPLKQTRVRLAGFSGSALIGEGELAHCAQADRHHILLNCQATGDVLRWAVEIVVHRKQGVRLQLAENPAQFLLNSVDRVKEVSAIHVQLPGTQLPVRAQKEMKPEKFMLGFIEKSLADQTEIRDIFFIPPAPDLAPFIPANDREPGMTDVFFFLDTIPKSCIAGSEYTP